MLIVFATNLEPGVAGRRSVPAPHSRTRSTRRTRRSTSSRRIFELNCRRRGLRVRPGDGRVPAAAVLPAARAARCAPATRATSLEQVVDTVPVPRTASRRSRASCSTRRAAATSSTSRPAARKGTPARRPTAAKATRPSPKRRRMGAVVPFRKGEVDAAARRRDSARLAVVPGAGERVRRPRAASPASSR